MVEGDDSIPDPTGPELPVFARALLIAHQRDAIDYIALRTAQLTAAGKDADAAFWAAVQSEAQRQIDANEWHPA